MNVEESKVLNTMVGLSPLLTASGVLKKRSVFSAVQCSRWRWILLGGCCAFQCGCATVVSYIPAALGASAAGIAGNAWASRFGWISASDTVYHDHPPLKNICVAFNSRVQIADFLPALQSELRRYEIESRVYEIDGGISGCDAWLYYGANFAWDESAHTAEDAQSYITDISLTLYQSSGVLISASSYRLEKNAMGKWASVGWKLAPVVKDLLLGPQRVEEHRSGKLRKPQASAPQ